MTRKKKLVYEKPISIDAGNVASVMGAICSTGFGAGSGECVSGVNPDLVPACLGTGANATNNCEHNGGAAGQNCLAQGQSADFVCSAGGVATYG